MENKLHTCLHMHLHKFYRRISKILTDFVLIELRALLKGGSDVATMFCKAVITHRKLVNRKNFEYKICNCRVIRVVASVGKFLTCDV